MITRIFKLLATCLIVAGLGVPAVASGQGRRAMPARAAPAARAAPVRAKVDMEIRVVYATSSHSNIDSRLSSLARYLSHLRFTGYELLDTQKAQISLGGKASFNVEGGRKITVSLLGRDEARARVRVQVTGSRNQQILDTTMSVNRDGTVIVAGPKYKDGILVLPLTARY